MIEALYKTIEELRSTSSQLEKREILARNYEPILPILRMAISWEVKNEWEGGRF